MVNDELIEATINLVRAKDELSNRRAVKREARAETQTKVDPQKAMFAPKEKAAKAKNEPSRLAVNSVRRTSHGRARLLPILIELSRNQLPKRSAFIRLITYVVRVFTLRVFDVRKQRIDLFLREIVHQPGRHERI